MRLNSPPVFRPEDFPEVDEKLLSLLSLGFRDVFNALQQVPQLQFRKGLKFTSSASGTAYLDIAMATPPEHIWVTRLESDAELATAYSQTWVRFDGKARALFAGLDADTAYTATVAFV